MILKKLLLLAALLATLPALSRTLTVSPTGPFSTIRQAIGAAADGDTVRIRKGVYYLNNAVITKSLTLLGEDYPLLHGADKYELLTLSGRHIVIKGLHFAHSGYSSMNDYAAIKVVDASDITIENNRITGAYFGIHVANSDHFTIRNNRLSGLTRTEQTTGNGIHLWKCTDALVQGNTVSGHRDGIYFEFVSASVVQDNRSEGNIRYGLHFMFSNDDRYVNNIFENNGAGVAVMYSKTVTMERNRFRNNWGAAAYGLLLKEISDSKIEGNLFFRNTVGLHLEGTNRIQVEQNVFDRNGWAARVQASCNDNNFRKNNFLGNTFDIATNGDLVLNHFEHNYWDKYEGYDLDRNGTGDVPYHPVSLYATVIEQNPNSLLLLRSFMVSLLDKAEKALPSLTPEALKDEKPLMRAWKDSLRVYKFTGLRVAGARLELVNP
ncbi:nitrous oxide reductase family maturation protein NosD [Paraflavisolibacter sp. H34]|uniref:nitrous oxide reductase family maturation protein NosD n=1 Tax=Huijunlia imazamoxiresistens TaxID=3127457 RepID=UPI003018D500